MCVHRLLKDKRIGVENSSFVRKSQVVSLLLDQDPIMGSLKTSRELTLEEFEYFIDID